MSEKCHNRTLGLEEWLPSAKGSQTAIEAGLLADMWLILIDRLAHRGVGSSPKSCPAFAGRQAAPRQTAEGDVAAEGTYRLIDAGEE
jgi:hypothetical protein